MERIKWIDISKGIAILLVVVGHCCNPTGQLAKIIFSFHMPFFFIIAGYLFKENITFSELLYKKAARLLIPYFYTLAIIFGYWYLFGRHMFYDPSTPAAILNILAKDFLSGSGIGIPEFNLPSVGPLWFIICLFFAQLIFYNVIKLIKNIDERLQWLIISLICLTGYGISRIVFLPWSLDIAIFAQIFLFIGYKFNEKDIFNKNYSFNLYVILLFLWVIGFLTYPISMNNREYHSVIYPIICATSGSFLLIKLSMIISNTKHISDILSYIGKISLIILIFHTMDTSYFHFNLLPRLIQLYNGNHWVSLCVFRLLFSVAIAEILRVIPIINSGFGLSSSVYKDLFHKSKLHSLKALQK